MAAQATLHLSSTLKIPAGVVTEPVGIYANRGYGKTYAAVKLVEQLYGAGLPSIILDIKGDFWGLRSDRTGKKPGLPFIIFGGDHADVPLEESPAAAQRIAWFLAERGLPAIIDLSYLSKTKARTWAMNFAEALYDAKRKHRTPLMLVVDEADILIPQRLAAELMRLLGAMEDIAKRGRARGLGLIVISQRVADVNKSVTDLLTTLLLGNTTGARQRKALNDWIDDHARDDAEIRTVIASLSTLEAGQFWVWSPTFLKILERVDVARIDTFDSYATPEPGQVLQLPKTIAAVDLDSLTAELTASIEKAREDDPAELRARIRRLEMELDATRGSVARLEKMPAETTIEYVDVPVLTGPEQQMLEDLAAQWDQMTGVVADSVHLIRVALERAAHPPVATPPSPAPVPAPGRPVPRPIREDGDRRPDAGTGDVRVPDAQKALLNGLAWYESAGFATVTRQQLAGVLGQSAGGGAFSNKLGALRSAGLIDYPFSGGIALTDAGRAHAIVPNRALTSKALQEKVLDSLPGALRLFLEALIRAYPYPMTRAELGQAVGQAPEGGAFSNKLGRLRTLGWIVYPATGQVRAADSLYVEA